MRWIVGLDLLDLSHGAVRLAAWLHRNAASERFSGVHVLGAQPRRYGRADQTEAELRTWVLGLAKSAVSDLGLAEHLDDISVLDADDADEGLEEALEVKGGSAVIIGRRAKRGEDAIVRLGKVARRLIRRLPAPIVVVPPDLEEELGDGPIVLATDFGASSESALRFAVELAATVDRELVVVHAITVQSALQVYIGPSAWDRAHVEAIEEGQKAAEAWLLRHQIGARVIVVDGPTGQTILGACARERAAMLVVGSRRLSFAERIFSSSVGAELAALAAIPVVIVPPEAPGA